MTRLLALCLLLASLGAATATATTPAVEWDGGLSVLGHDASGDVGPEEPASLEATGDVSRQRPLVTGQSFPRTHLHPRKPSDSARIRAPPGITL